MKSKWLTESLPAEATVAVALAGGGGGRGLRGWCVLFLIWTGIPGDQSPCCRLPLCTSLCPTSVKSLLRQ